MTDDHDAHAANLVRSAMHLAPADPLTGTAQRLAALIAADRRASVAAERERITAFILAHPYEFDGDYIRNRAEELVDAINALDAAQATPDAAGPAGGE